MVKIILKFGPAVIKEYPVPPTQTSVSIGRKSDNDIIIDNPVVSGIHARIVKQGESFFVEDLNSTNGTYLAGRKIVKSGITNGDEIVIGSHTIIFLDEAQKQEVQPAQKAPSPDQTIVMEPSKKEELLRKTVQSGERTTEKIGTLVVTSGALEKSEYELSGLVTYIGKSENAHVKLKGLFMPDMGAAINKRQEGYILVALKDGFPEINGRKITGQTQLQDGDELKAGGTTFRFYLKEVSK